MVGKKTDVRIEGDRLGDVQIPVNAYWGAQTARIREHFSISGQRVHPRLIDALSMVKKAAALANAEAGRLDQGTARAISQVCDEIVSGQWRDQFVVDSFQFGAGASLVTNMNEVIANRGSELLGGSPGTYDRIHPQHQVNLGQSYNDVFPTAMRVSIFLSLRELEPVLLDLERLLRRKSLEFEKVVKVGRTHLQDSAPITLGQEFNAYGSSIERSVRRIKDSSHNLLESNLGCMSVGTGFGTEPAYSTRVIEILAQTSGMKFRQAEDVFRATHSMADFVEFSSSLRELAIELSKIASDLRLLGSGPHAGLGEVVIPPVQFEQSDLSSILPERTPPYVTEILTMVCFRVLGNDFVVSQCAQSGRLDSNSMTPLLIDSILSSIELLKNCVAAFNQHCLTKLTANIKHCQELVERSGATAAAMSAYIGVEKANELLELSRRTGRSFRDLALEQKLLSADVLDRILHYKSLTRPSNVPIGTVKRGTTFNTNAPIDQS